MNLSRRDMLKLGAGAAAVWATGARALVARAAADGKIPIGLQLYSVREDCDQGPARRAGGRRQDGLPGRGVRRLLRPQRRRAAQAAGRQRPEVLRHPHRPEHAHRRRAEGDRRVQQDPRQQVPDRARPAAGPASPRPTPASRPPQLFTETAAKVKGRGMHVGYHAHGGDFKKFDGETPWDILFSNTGPDVVMQLDIGNCLDGGGDPIAILKKFPGRSVTIHLKEHGGPRARPSARATSTGRRSSTSAKPPERPSGTSSSRKATPAGRWIASKPASRTCGRWASDPIDVHVAYVGWRRSNCRNVILLLEWTKSPSATWFFHVGWRRGPAMGRNVAHGGTSSHPTIDCSMSCRARTSPLRFAASPGPSRARRWRRAPARAVSRWCRSATPVAAASATT